MKIIGLVVAFLLFATLAWADVSAKVLSIEKEVRNNKPRIKVITEYTYPDKSKHIGVIRYSYLNFTKVKVAEDIKIHCETITKYYLEGNSEAMLTKENQIIDGFISEQATLPEAEKITKVTYSLKDLYIPDLDLTIQTEGKTKEPYK